MRAGVVAPAFLFAFFTDFKFPRMEALGRWVNKRLRQPASSVVGIKGQRKGCRLL